jgi:DNA repair protein RadA/Sms
LQRLGSGYGELDRVLGGGLVPGSLVLVGGDPGIGKSTLLLQSAEAMAGRHSVLYVSAEESAQQVKLRWRRLGGDGSQLQLLAETDLELVLQELESLRPAVAIIDSIQALHDGELTSAPGSVAQVRECAAALARIAKRQDTALLLVGHVTKEGLLAGPKVLEHLVDAVLTFEGDRFASHRLLRAVKNRFGATHELGVFEMRDRGLVEVTNPSELFLGSDEPSAGTATIVACEGTRALVVELQSLVSTTSYASPRRTATGIGTNRLHQILAVLEKHLGLPLSRFDCYLAVAGGLVVEEPAGRPGRGRGGGGQLPRSHLAAWHGADRRAGAGWSVAAGWPVGAAAPGGGPVGLPPGGGAKGQWPGADGGGHRSAAPGGRHGGRGPGGGPRR